MKPIDARAHTAFPERPSTTEEMFPPPMKHGHRDGNGTEYDAQIAELFRASEHIERKVDAALREIHGAGREPGLRGMLARLDVRFTGLEKSLRDLDTDLGVQRKELFEALTEQSTKQEERITRLGTDLGDRLKRPVFDRVVLLLSAVAAAAAIVWMALRPHG